MGGCHKYLYVTVEVSWDRELTESVEMYSGDRLE